MISHEVASLSSNDLFSRLKKDPHLEQQERLKDVRLLREGFKIKRFLGKNKQSGSEQGEIYCNYSFSTIKEGKWKIIVVQHKTSATPKVPDLPDQEKIMKMFENRQDLTKPNTATSEEHARSINFVAANYKQILPLLFPVRQKNKNGANNYIYSSDFGSFTEVKLDKKRADLMLAIGGHFIIFEFGKNNRPGLVGSEDFTKWEKNGQLKEYEKEIKIIVPEAKVSTFISTYCFTQGINYLELRPGIQVN